MSPRPRFVTQIHKFRGDTMRKIIFGSLLASTMLVPAFAQTNPPASTTPSAQPSTPPATSSSATVAPKAHGDMWRASKLIGLNVYNDQNEKLGDISEVLLDKSGKVDGIVIGVGGIPRHGQARHPGADGGQAEIRQRAGANFIHDQHHNGLGGTAGNKPKQRDLRPAHPRPPANGILTMRC